jgi:hypothetical protein
MRIKKKVWPEFFQQILEGEKKFELRLADFRCSPGDILVLEEWDPKASKYTGRHLEKEVTSVLRTKDITFWPEDEIAEHGLQIISFH